MNSQTHSISALADFLPANQRTLRNAVAAGLFGSAASRHNKGPWMITGTISELRAIWEARPKPGRRWARGIKWKSDISQ